jgi:hypothetical protein
MRLLCAHIFMLRDFNKRSGSTIQQVAQLLMARIYFYNLRPCHIGNQQAILADYFIRKNLIDCLLRILILARLLRI